MSTADQSHPLFKYDGQIGELYRIFLGNLLFTVITLGIYRFWATTRNRRYIWSHLSFQDERFEYTGTGGELLVGFLLAIGAVLGIALVTLGGGVLLARATYHNGYAVAGVLLFYLALLILAMGAYFSAQRYRLSRTRWYGIRGGMRGSALAYGAWALLYVIYAVFTLGQLMPWVTLRLQERKLNASSFGNARFDFHGQAGKLYLAFLATLLAVLALVVAIFRAGHTAYAALMRSGHPDAFGHPAVLPPGTTPASLLWAVLGYYLLMLIGAVLIGSFYRALLVRHIASRTMLGTQLRFGSTITGRRLLVLLLTNLAIAIGTLGLGFPIVLHRALRLMADTLTVSGTLGQGDLQQNTDDTPRTGEGMLNLLDHGGAF